jgi:integrase/recombinase XerD
LAAHYPAGDPYPGLAGAWIARQKTRNTRITYVRQYRVWDAYARETGTHPLEARFPLAEAFSRYLETAPTLRPVKGGHRGEKAPTGPPRSDAARANLLSACSSFYKYAVRARGEARPLRPRARPEIDQDGSDTQGSTEEESARLLTAAREDGPRSYALLMAIYSIALRLDSALGAQVEDLGYDKGHRILNVRLKGGRRKPKVVPPATGHAIDVYLDGRTTGPLFQTRTGNPLDPAYVWKLVRRLAARRPASPTPPPSTPTSSSTTPSPTPWTPPTPSSTTSRTSPTTRTRAPPAVTTAARDASTTAPATASPPASPNGFPATTTDRYAVPGAGSASRR